MLTKQTSISWKFYKKNALVWVSWAFDRLSGVSGSKVDLK